MVLQMREDRVDDTGAVVLRKGQRVTAKPTPRLGYYRVCADGPPYRVPVSAVEPVDDLDLPEPEPVKIEVMLRESASEWRLSPPADRMAWPVALAGGVIVAVALGAAFLGVV